MAASSSRPSFSRAPRRKLSETVAEQLLEAFRDLPPGTKVPSERELTLELDVGRTTVREALNGLAMLGVIEIRHGQGAFITVPHAAEAAGQDPHAALTAALERGVTREFIEARLLVEVAVARLAAQRRTDEDLRQIESALAEQERTQAGPLNELLSVATRFNVLLAEAAHNEVLAGMTRSFVSLMYERAPKVYALEGFPAWDLEEHQGLYEAVRTQDADLAADLMRRHILELSERYRRVGAG